MYHTPQIYKKSEQICLMNFTRIPFVYAIFIAVLCLTFMAKENCIDIMDLWNYAMIPGKVIRFELWRLVTYHLFNTNIVHLLINIIVLMQIGPGLEIKLGHFGFLLHTILLSVLVGASYTLGSIISLSIDKYRSFYHPVIGSFGLVLAITSIDVYITEQRFRSVFGVFHVPSKLYPIVIALLYHIALPDSSYISSLSGLFVGVCYAVLSFKPPPQRSYKSNDKHSNYGGNMYQDKDVSNDGIAHSPFALFTMSWLQSDQRNDRGDKL